MNYRHAYHAGNFADVVKHLALVLLIEHLTRKSAPFCVVDTHAGIGAYDLQAEAARRTGEAEGGIGRLWSASDLPEPVARYRDLVRRFDGGPAADKLPRRYPGSPALARALLRPDDRLVLCELHPEDVRTLRRVFAGDRRVAVHHMDGFLAAKAFLPPPERRGLVLMDPPYEDRADPARTVKALATAHSRWPGGHFVLWYPIKESAAVWRLHEAVAAAGLPKVLTADLTIRSGDDPARLNGCGLLFVNPPWQLDRMLEAVLPDLQHRLAIDGGGVSVGWLVPEAAPGSAV